MVFDYDLGANPTVTTIKGHTAIGLACMNDSPDILRELLAACSNYTPRALSDESSYSENQSSVRRWRRREVHAQSQDPTTPDGMEGLEWEDEIEPRAAHNSDQMSAGVCNTLTEEDDDEWSVLYRYYASVIEKTGEMLANTISAREPHCLDATGKAPIHYAAANGSLACMEQLLKHKAPVNMANDSGYTALHLAVHNPGVVRLLLQHKANPNKLTFYDQLAPIHLAAKIGNTETVSTIIRFNSYAS